MHQEKRGNKLLRVQHAQGDAILVSNPKTQVPLEALNIQEMASGHLCLVLSLSVNWENFPEYARRILMIVGGTVVNNVDSVDTRLLGVSIDGVELRLVYEDYPLGGVEFESMDELGDILIRRLFSELLQHK